VLNYIWLAMVLLAVAIGGWNDRLKDVTGGALDGAKTAVTIAIAGDVKKDALLADLEKSFGKWHGAAGKQKPPAAPRGGSRKGCGR